MEAPIVTFRRLRTEDLVTLVEWFADPVVERWWHQPADLESVTAKYAARIAGTGDPTEMWIAEIDGEPTGLLQCYRDTDYPDHDAAVGIDHAVGIDYLLGPTHRGRGLAGPILSEFAELALRRFPECTVCVATPARANRASWRALEHAGFVRSHECQSPDEPPGYAYVFAPPTPNA